MRARNIKPALFKNELLGKADPLYTILFEGLWCMADRLGRLEDRPAKIKAEVFPYRDVDVEAGLKWLFDANFIDRYATKRTSVISVREFLKHQRPHKNETLSVLPARNQRVRTKKTLHHGATSAQPRTQALRSDPLLSDSGSLIPDSGFPTPTPPKGGAVRHRRSPERAEKDAALEVWNRLVASDGAEPKRDSKLQAALDAVGGWARIQHRENGIDDSMVRRQFCDAYRNRDNGQ